MFNQPITTLTFKNPYTPLEPEETTDYDTSSLPVEVPPPEETSVSYPPEEVPCEEPPNYSTSSYTYYSASNARVADNDTNPQTLIVDFDVTVSTGGRVLTISKRVKLCKETLLAQAIQQDNALTTNAPYVESNNELSAGGQRMLELAGVKHPKNFLS